MIGPTTRAGRVDGRRILRPGETLHSLRLDAVRPAYLAAALVAVLVGRMAGLDPALAIAMVVGIAVAVLAVSNLTVGLLVFTVAIFLEDLPTMSGLPSIAKLIGMCLIIGWLLTTTMRSDTSSRDLASQNPVLVGALCGFLSWVLFSLLWAEDSFVARTSLTSFALNFVLFPIAFFAFRSMRHIVWFYSVFIASALLGVVVGLLSSRGLGAGQVERLDGAGINANYLGALLVVSAVLAAALACDRGLNPIGRLVAFIASALCVVSVFLTASRGATVALVVGILVTPLVAGRGRRLGALALVVVVGASIATWLALVVPQATFDRLTQPTDGGGAGRLDLWTVGLRMVADKPVAGVGAGNFPVSSIHYLLEPGIITRPNYFIDEPAVTHNIYLQVLAELGFIGLTLFLTIILASLYCTLLAARAFKLRGDTGSEILARGHLIALVTLLAALFFSSLLYSKQLYLLLAVAPALLAISRRGQPVD